MEGMKKIEWLEDVKIGTSTRIKGTTDFVNEEEYKLYVLDTGWAKNADTGETGERVAGAKRVQIHNIRSEIQ